MSSHRCWRCDRAMPELGGSGYVFGRVCDRRECQQVKQALSKCDTWHWFRMQPPEPDGSLGRGGGYSLDGERQTPRGMCEPDLQEKIDMDRRVPA
jgi:hypothetical protein